MPLSQQTRRIIAFAREKARDPEFLYRTADRRPANHPTQTVAEEHARKNGLKWPPW